MKTAMLAGWLAGCAAFFPAAGPGHADAAAAAPLADSAFAAPPSYLAVHPENMYRGTVHREAGYGTFRVFAADVRGDEKGPADDALRRSLLSLEERIDSRNRLQRELLRDIAALRRENLAAARALTREQRLAIRTEVRAVVRDIRAARREFRKLREQTEEVMGRFRYHRRQLDWEAVQADLALIARYGEQAAEQLKRELEGERKLGEWLQRARDGAPPARRP